MVTRYYMLLGVLALLITFPWWSNFVPAVTSKAQKATAPRTVFPPPPGSPPQGMVSLNFDDGFLSAYEIAFPILEEAGMRGTLYLISRHMEPPLYMTRAQALDIQSRGHEIGAHTREHVRLSGLTYSEIQDEVIGSKEDLEKMGFRGVDTFAYPFGDYNQDVLAVVKEAGFIAARGTHPGFNHAATDPFQLQSKLIEKGRSIEEIRALIDRAVQEKTWLILAFHRMGDKGNRVSASPEMLQQIVDYLIEKKVPVVTMHEGYELVFNRNNAAR